MEEKIFYQSTDVSVTQSRVIARGTTYSLRNISSVSKYVIPPNRTGPVIMILIGLVLLIPEDARIVGGLLIVGGLVWWFVQKTYYTVRLMSNAGEVRAYTSADENLIGSIVTAINDAIMYQSQPQKSSSEATVTIHEQKAPSNQN